MQYRGKQDMRQIGDALRVSHVLEGTVRRFGGKVHINAQLVDTHTDAGIWAEEYERDLNDVFAIETEVAQSIANRLRAKVSAREKVAMQEWPTKDLVAYDLYTRARLLLLPNFRSNAKAKLLQADRMRHYETWHTLSTSTRATLPRSSRSPMVTTFSGVTPKKHQC